MLARQNRLPDPAALDIDPIDRDPAYQAALRELTELETRLAATTGRRNTAKARLRGAKPARSALARAKDLLAGGQVGASDPVDDLKACDEEEYQILRPAIVEATRALDEISGNASLALCNRIKPQYAVALASALHAMESLAAALDAAAAIRATVRAAGYSPLSTVLPDIAPAGARQLGNPAAVGQSQAWYFRNALQEAGLL